ncbi:MAG: metallophosphoesterase, partial [Clostridia bacterium]|nr:metallophosphoesterase [Clostridia bacterium]
PMNIFGPVWDNYIDTIITDWKEKVTENDVVLIGGDISWAMRFEDAKPDIDLISKLPGKKIMIRGNHDYWWKSISAVRSLLNENFYALQNDHVTIGEYIFCGTRGWQVPEKIQSNENEKIFKREVLRLELSLQSAKKEQENLNNDAKIICLIHFPPFNSRFQESEFTKLFKKYSVDAVIYGHLHGKTSRSEKLIKINGIPYYLTSCDQIDNKLIQINI